jgi:CRP-like cAMP-binding protein
MVSLLDEDPDLGCALDAAAFDHARHTLVAPAENLPVGQWIPSDNGDLLGLLVLSGLLVRELRLGVRARYAELLGPGDVLRPWQEQDAGILPWTSSWRVLEDARVATLGRGVARGAARWPEVTENLTARALERARRQSIAASIPNLVRIQDRLIVLFLHLAERWGRVTRDGIVVQLPLTHEIIGRLAGARRPSVTTSLTALGMRGVIVRTGMDQWVLGPAIHDELDAILTGRVVDLDQRASLAS